MFSIIRYVLLLSPILQLSAALHINNAGLQTPFDPSLEASKNQHEALVKAGVIPDVLDDFEPSVSILVSYPFKHKSVKLGNTIKPKAVASEPVFGFSNLDTVPTRTSRSNASYVLALTDPDATSRADPIKAQMCHWIVTNITSNSIIRLDSASDGLQSLEYRDSGVHELMPYVPPTPPPGTGYHRYVFVVFQQSANDSETEGLKKPKDRPHWGYGKVGAGVREWADENELTIVGANFFYSRNKKQ